MIAVREMTLDDDAEEWRKALAKILPMQRDDFVEIFRIMKGLPVTIRLLDPPLHEFLPKSDKDMQELVRTTGKDIAAIRHRTHGLHEANPMLGHRGGRLAILGPEIDEMTA